MYTCAALRPRRRAPVRPDPGLTALCFDLCPVAFRIPDRVGSSIHDFRGSISPPAYPLSTLRNHPHGWTTQDSLPAGGPLPWPVGLSPMGRDRKFQLATSAFPFSKLLLAQPESHRENCGLNSPTSEAAKELAAPDRRPGWSGNAGWILRRSGSFAPHCRVSLSG